MIKLTVNISLNTNNTFRVYDYIAIMNEPVTEVKKYDINRRIYLPKWVEEDLGIIPGQSYVTFVQDGKNIVIKKVSISIA